MAPSSNRRWVVDCLNCRATFVHSEIRPDKSLIDYLYPMKPPIPDEGQEMECPSCQTKAIYMRHALRYEGG
jgi:hypothetical protein